MTTETRQYDYDMLNQLLKNLKLPTDGMAKVKVALLGDSATQFLGKALVAQGRKVNLDIDLYEADYDQIDLQILAPDSELYQFAPDFVLIFECSEKLLQQFQKTPTEERAHFYKKKIDRIEALRQAVVERSTAKIIRFNFVEIDDAVFGNYANKLTQSFVYQSRKLNVELMDWAVETKGIFIADVQAVQSRIGRERMFDPKFYVNSSMTLAPDALPDVSLQIIKIIAAVRGQFKKCLILDLDNTTWGGVIGDDGMENIQIGSLGIGKAFSELQRWAKALKERGIILAVCSKNTDHIAREPFERHPDMVLRLEDISIFVANWQNKADNIRYIQSVLNIGFDSMVFLDDNPFERNLIRDQLPTVTVPELPEDPAEYLPYLRRLNLFETASYSAEDTKRTAKYQEEAKRVNLQESFSSIDDYLESLEMEAEVVPINTFNTPRVAQLTQRSNQFNLRTIRYTEKEISDIATSLNYHSQCISLHDKFGDYGLISVLILKYQTNTLFVDTWIMSCRVLKRGVERFVLNHLVELARQNNCTTIVGEYLPTPKNGIVKDHYTNLGFVKKNEKWYLDLATYSYQENYINAK